MPQTTSLRRWTWASVPILVLMSPVEAVYAMLILDRAFRLIRTGTYAADDPIPPNAVLPDRGNPVQIGQTSPPGGHSALGLFQSTRTVRQY